VTTPQDFSLALEHFQAGRLGDAEAVLRGILAGHRDHADALHLYGIIALGAGRPEVAVPMLQRAVTFAPEDHAALSNLGEACRAAGRIEEAITAFRRALRLRPGDAIVRNNLGLALMARGEIDLALTELQQAREITPDSPEVLNNLGCALRENGRMEEAVPAFRRAVELKPEYAEAQNNLGLALKEEGKLDAAMGAFREALRLKPQLADANSNLIMTMLYDPARSRGAVREEGRRWEQACAQTQRRFSLPPGYDDDPRRRLRIGYVSPDFYSHAVGKNIVPLFRCHDGGAFDITCYSATKKPDSLTAELQRYVRDWREVAFISDDALAEMIRQDGVDILVDLTQHAAGNRLPAFARQPAPVQVSFAGYPESTGLETIQYRISDRYLESEIEDRRREIGAEGRAAEQVFLLDSFWCYDPCGVEVEVNELPAGKCGRITFGCLNNFSKINEPMLKLWSRVLRAVEDSRLLVLASEGPQRQWIVHILEREGITAQRVEFVPRSLHLTYLERYQRVDIALDPFPYNGHTTSLDALWMGVPVVTLAGRHPVSRGGLSQLSNLGLAELAADAEEEFVEIGVRLAGDLPRLAELRRTLRGRMETSRLMDAQGFARSIEAAYRTAWRHWFATRGSKEAAIALG